MCIAWTAQYDPFHRSASAEPVDADVFSSPTARHEVDDEQVTASSSLPSGPPGLAAFRTVQILPFQDSASGSSSGSSALPTARHHVADEQVTAVSSLAAPAASGAGNVVQAWPFQPLAQDV